MGRREVGRREVGRMWERGRRWRRRGEGGGTSERAKTKKN